MKCPWCGDEMSPGTLRFDGRSAMRWIPEGVKKSAAERFWDALGGVGLLTAQENNGWGTGRLAAAYCSLCKKMVIETDIEK